METWYAHSIAAHNIYIYILYTSMCHTYDGSFSKSKNNLYYSDSNWSYHISRGQAHWICPKLLIVIQCFTNHWKLNEKKKWKHLIISNNSVCMFPISYSSYIHRSLKVFLFLFWTDKSTFDFCRFCNIFFLFCFVELFFHSFY